MRRRRRHRHPDAKGFVTPPERLFEISRLPDRMRSRLVTGPRLLVAEHNGREARYFVMVDVEGTPTLSGPELHVHCAENSSRANVIQHAMGPSRQHQEVPRRNARGRRAAPGLAG